MKIVHGQDDAAGSEPRTAIIIGLADNPCDYCGQGVGPPGPQSGPVYLVCNPFNGRSEPLHEDCAGFWFEWLGKVAKDVRDRVLSHRCPT